MTKDTLEHLSSLMDGELTQDAGRFVARRMGADDELSATWQRYHLIRDCMRRPGEGLATADIKLDFDQLDEAPTATVNPGSSAPRWLKPLGGLAVAASVAMVAVLVTLNLNPGVEPAAPALAQPFASPNSLNGFPISQPASLNPPSADSQKQLKRYLLRHNQVAGAVGPKGFVTFVPIVTSAPVQVVEADSPVPEPEASAADVSDSVQR